MSYEEYQKRVWRVLPPGAPECPSFSKVFIEGPSGKVTVRCNADFPYGKENGVYEKESDTIEGDTYVISMKEVGTNRQIMFEPRERPVAESWTADDQSSWPEAEDG